MPPSRLLDALSDRYAIRRELGRGGMATVYLARDLKHDRDVALKLLHPGLAAALGPERFLREIRIAAHLQHPHILTLIDSGEVAATGGRPPNLYFVMPYVAGETLRQRLATTGKLPVADALRILQDLLDALAHAHEQGIVHRDIKPENIMLVGRHALLMDFGVARAAVDAATGEAQRGDTLTTVGLAIGTPTYMAPEQAAGQARVDARADLYAVGAVGYEMLAGAPPITGPTAQAIVAAQITQVPEPLANQRPDAPAPLSAALMRALAKDPDERWPSAGAMLAELGQLSTPGAGLPAAGTRRDRTPWVVAALAFVAAIALAPFIIQQAGRSTRGDAVARMLALSDRGEWDSVWRVARQEEKAGPNPALEALKDRLVRTYRIITEPSGAKVWLKGYAAPDSAWALLGSTPLDSAIAPMSGSGGRYLDANRLRIEAPGYRTLELVGLPFDGEVIRLDSAGSIPDEMVRIAGGTVEMEYPGFHALPGFELADFLMDRYEVTNREYKQFVDAGGYARREFWDQAFVREGQSLSWEAAMRHMTDPTGRPGPSTWEAGEHAAGTEDHPVSGVSWYEAMAYARFAGKSLPTVVHWNRAASIMNSAWIVPASNFANRGTLPVGSTRSISAFGTYDMAGNVREWCLNASGGERFILGGGYNDSPNLFTDTYTQPPFDRSPSNGIRLVRYGRSDRSLTLASAPLNRVLRDFSKATPVGDQLFAVYRQMFEYDRTRLDPVVQERVDEGAWTRELIRVNAAYGADSLLLYLYLPKQGPAPHPAVIFFPPGNAIRLPAFQAGESRHFDYIIKTGRAVLFPVYKGTFQRHDSLKTDVQDSSTFYRDHVVMWGKDIGRAIDYLETREDITTENLAYYGISFGGSLGATLPAIEPRLRVSVLLVAGLDFPPVRPEVDPVNFLPRVKIPTLMLNGRYDFFFPVETSQRHMFRLLGTPAEHKRHVIAEGSHFVSRVETIRETLAWLDKYQPIRP